MKKISVKLCCFGMLLVVGLTDAGLVLAQQRSFDANRKQEVRQRRIEEFRAIRQIEHQERLHRLNDKAPPSQASSHEGGQSALSPRASLESEGRTLPKFNRLTPEERMALRRQIREARDDIYLKRQEKN